MSFEIVHGDTGPAMNIDLSADTTDADSVQLRWMKPDGSVYMTSLTAVNTAEGLYKMEWGPDDTDTLGVHLGEVVVTTGGTIETYPADGVKLVWFVTPNINDWAD